MNKYDFAILEYNMWEAIMSSPGCNYAKLLIESGSLSGDSRERKNRDIVLLANEVLSE